MAPLQTLNRERLFSRWPTDYESAALILSGLYIVQWDLILLIDEPETTEFAVHPSRIRSAIFDAGVTSRINVGCFMADLISDDATWMEWL